MNQQLLALSDVSCCYVKDACILHDVSFTLKKGEQAALLGPSGCGKTTLLRAIAGFEPITSGKITFDGRVLSTPSENVPPEKRKIGFVFQDATLFPHMTIKENVAFGIKHLKKNEINRICDETLSLVGLLQYEKRYPHELSGGQQQRVALARTLSTQPKLVLLDEAFANLDTLLRRKLAADIKLILKEHEIASILVTHDQDEAFAFGEKVGVMHNKSLLHWDDPYSLYHKPVNKYVAEFVGHGVFVKGHVLDDHTLETEIGQLTHTTPIQLNKNTKIDLLLRPDDVVYNENSNLSAVVTQKSFKGANTLYTMALSNGTTLKTIQPSHRNYEIGAKFPFSIDSTHLIFFEEKH